MTDRINGLIVVLEHDTREDDVQSLIDAIRHFRKVIDVKPNVTDVGGLISDVRADQVWRNKILDMLRPTS
jgi:hypothetical protein